LKPRSENSRYVINDAVTLHNKALKAIVQCYLLVKAFVRLQKLCYTDEITT